MSCMRWCRVTTEYPIMSKSQVMKPSLKMAAAALLAASWCSFAALPQAVAGETRTLSLYQVHTKESLTVTYKKNGRYIPSAMSKLNYLLRDWRRDSVIKMDPKTIDLMWELHADLGSRKPIHIISGYRSSKTNAMLKRIGRRVARRSRHIKGQAIDLYFPDVPTSRLRGSALVRKIGGVGYYPRSGKTGFVHIDSGTVRHWPRLSKSKMAKIFRDYRKTVGARRYNKQPATLFASASPPAEKATKASTGPTTITPAVLHNQSIVAAVVPRPRARPAEVQQMAQAYVHILPTSADAQARNFGSLLPGIGDIASLITATTEPADNRQRSNIAAKGSLTKDILNGTADDTPTIQPLLAARTVPTDESAAAGWPVHVPNTADSLFRRDGAPQQFSQGETATNGPVTITVSEDAALEQVIASLAPENQIDVDLLVPNQATAISGKADKMNVNRTGKSDLLMPASVTSIKRRTSSARQFEAKFDSIAEAILRSSEKPIRFE